MAIINVVDEGIIDVDCSTVFKAYIDEFGGVTHLWMPLWESKPRGENVVVQKGIVADITANWKGTTKFAIKVIELVKDKLFIEELIEGDFIGTGEWRFKPLDGKTKVSFRWKVKTNKPSLTFAARFIDIGKRHSELVQELFKIWNRYLSKSKITKI
jgi:hypothetical protein